MRAAVGLVQTHGHELAGELIAMGATVEVQAVQVHGFDGGREVAVGVTQQTIGHREAVLEQIQTALAGGAAGESGKAVELPVHAVGGVRGVQVGR